jgi:DNA-binding MarR family transcriptional regulator/GNAT superfamily N-acetyltransferase
MSITDDTVAAEKIAAVRRFNRFYTRTIGVLGDGIQRTDYSLTEARLFYELSRGGQVETLSLRRRLGLDPGYLSRILGRFESEGLVELGRSTVDNRRQTVELTPAGRTVFAKLDQHAVEDMAALLGRLSETSQHDLLSAMGLIERLWSPAIGQADDSNGHEGGAGGGAVRLRGPLPGELGWVVQRHGVIYAREYGYTDEFEAFVSGIVADFVKNRQASREAAWIAEVEGTPAGCVFCVAKDETTAQLRLLLVEPWARGLGLGGLLVGECLRFARASGYQEMVLWTNAELEGARKLYRKAGFGLVSQERAVQFGGAQVFENWRISL